MALWFGFTYQKPGVCPFWCVWRPFVPREHQEAKKNKYKISIKYANHTMKVIREYAPIVQGLFWVFRCFCRLYSRFCVTYHGVWLIVAQPSFGQSRAVSAAFTSVIPPLADKLLWCFPSKRRVFGVSGGRRAEFDWVHGPPKLGKIVLRRSLPGSHPQHGTRQTSPPRRCC